ncbi:DUF6817 domain-containing protein [Streptomyces sp. NPDC050418]|uniref:DUF6817 domain-containing protein n=1 Tax=Streptomyces sp. NPDC050418 TaxID=3365612 RepID=UPI00378729EA
MQPHPPHITPDAGPALRLLREHGATAMDHPGGTLLAHLQRVQRQLADWGARPDLQLAGLCHAFYGTDGFAQALLPLERRAELVAAIGTEAEELVHFYAACDRKVAYGSTGTYRDRFTDETRTPTAQERRDFAELTAANELDLAVIDEDFRRRHGAGLLDLFTSMRPDLSEAAWRSCVEILGERAEP